MARGRPHSLETKLGLVILKRGLMVYRVSGLTGISPRMMTEYLAGRRRIRDEHLVALCRVLDCDAKDISGDSHEDDPAPEKPMVGRDIRQLQNHHRKLIRREI